MRRTDGQGQTEWEIGSCKLPCPASSITAFTHKKTLHQSAMHRCKHESSRLQPGPLSTRPDLQDNGAVLLPSSLWGHKLRSGLLFILCNTHLCGFHYSYFHESLSLNYIKNIIDINYIIRMSLKSVFQR